MKFQHSPVPFDLARVGGGFQVKSADLKFRMLFGIVKLEFFDQKTNVIGAFRSLSSSYISVGDAQFGALLEVVVARVVAARELGIR